jgi:hypothetical protein
MKEPKKPWLLEDGGPRLDAFLGSRGMRTSELKTTANIIEMAAKVFEIPTRGTCLEMADAIAGMSLKERRRLARRNLVKSPVRVERARTAAAKPKTALGKLAAELKVEPAALRVALVTLAKNHSGAVDTSSLPLSVRASEAARHWRSGSNA